MSFPTDGLQRFRVGTVTGYSIADSGRTGSRAPSTVWVVTDRAVCHRTTGEFKRAGGWRSRTSAEQLARNLAARLEAECARAEAA